MNYTKKVSFLSVTLNIINNEIISLLLFVLFNNSIFKLRIDKCRRDGDADHSVGAPSCLPGTSEWEKRLIVDVLPHLKINY